jgi:dihydrofolate reductase
MSARLQLIVARARNGVIGNRGAMPWHLPEDLAHFKRTTMGHSIIMGRKTWDAIGRALPGRRNIVLTRTAGWRAPGAEAASSLDEAIGRCAQAAQQAFVIGGAEIYAQALARGVDTLHVTEIDAEFAGDTVFPAPDPARWREGARQHFAAGAGRPFAFDFVRYDAVPGTKPHTIPGDPDAQR